MPETATRAEILLAAQRLFAAQGFPRTTIKQIGEAAGVNTALLYYYFGDKERLYHEVLDRMVAALVSRTMDRLGGDADPPTRLRALLEAQAEVLAANPDLPRLLVRELADSEAVHATEQIHLLAATTFRRLCDLIREGQEAGHFRAELDPRFAAISTIAQVAYFFVARPAVRILLGYASDGPPPEVIHAFARHAADYALTALTTPSLSSRSSRVPARSRARPRSPRRSR